VGAGGLIEGVGMAPPGRIEASCCQAGIAGITIAGILDCDPADVGRGVVDGRAAGGFTDAKSGRLERAVRGG
jgi:hypothetical protein